MFREIPGGEVLVGVALIVAGGTLAVLKSRV